MVKEMAKDFQKVMLIFLEEEEDIIMLPSYLVAIGSHMMNSAVHLLAEKLDKKQEILKLILEDLNELVEQGHEDAVKKKFMAHVIAKLDTHKVDGP